MYGMSKIENFETEITPLGRKRTVWVYLPSNYDAKGDGYPVIYMHDGQNLFYDHLTAYGTAWHVDKALDEIYRTTGKACIVVGVECSDKVRMSEYSPWKASLHMQRRHKDKGKSNSGGEGALYAEWLAKTLKPYIDEHYNTDKQRIATAVAGSSMGGLISCYIGLAYQRVFETMGLFSTYTVFNQRAFDRFERDTEQTLPQHAFIYSGGKEWGEDVKANKEMVSIAEDLYHKLFARQICCELVVNSELPHYETAWDIYFRKFARDFLDRYYDNKQKQ